MDVEESSQTIGFPRSNGEYRRDSLMDRFGSVLRQVDVKPAFRKLTLNLLESRGFYEQVTEVKLFLSFPS